MKTKLEKNINLKSYRKLISASQYGRIYARFEGVAAFSVATEVSKIPDVEVTIDKESELKINDLIWGAHGSIYVGKDTLALNFGFNSFSVTFDPFGLSPVSVHLPAIRIPLSLKKLPGLGLNGEVVLQLEFYIDFIPDYRRLAKAVNARNVRALLSKAKNTLYKVGSKTKIVGRIVFKAGRAAVFAPFKKLGNYIGKTLAKDAIKLGSQTAALRKLAGRFGKLLGVGGIFLDTWLIVKASVPGVLGHHHARVIKVVNGEFAKGYAEFLNVMTNPSMPLTDAFFDMALKAKRVAQPPPDMLSVIEKLARTGSSSSPNKDVQKWKRQFGSSPKLREVTLPLSSTDWEELYRESYNLYFLYVSAAMSASGKQTRAQAWRGVKVAHDLIKLAGQIAAYQDIYGYVIASSLYEDVRTGKQPTDVWKEWRVVADFHRQVFGQDGSRRESWYLSLIDTANLRVSIPPFVDYR